MRSVSSSPPGLRFAAPVTSLFRVFQGGVFLRPVQAPAPSFPVSDRRPTVMSPATAVTRCSHSLGVNGFFRVYTPSSSSLLVCYLSSSLTPLSATLAAFPLDASRCRCRHR